jgi:hypothetical protein
MARRSYEVMPLLAASIVTYAIVRLEVFSRLFKPYVMKISAILGIKFSKMANE